MKTQLTRTALLLLLLQLNILAATSATIEGSLVDPSKSTVPFATIDLNFQNKIIKSTQSDLNGLFRFDSLQEGNYDIKISSVGYQSKTIKSIRVKQSEIKKIEITIESGVELQALEMVRGNNYKVNKWSLKGKENKKALNVKGSRDQSTIYIVDGMKVRPGYLISDTSDNYYQPEEQYDEIVENEFQSALREPLSTFSIDVDKASYTNVRRILNDGHLPPVNAVRIEELVNYFKYDYPKPANEDILAIQTEVANCPWDSSNILLKVAMKAKDVDESGLPASNFVFLIDVSGSMQDPNKLPLVKQSLKLLINRLKENDRIAIVVYAGNAGLVLNSTSGDDKEMIRQAINNLQAGGSTAGGEGIQLAYKIAEQNFNSKKNNRIILCTDGDFNVGVQSDGDLISLIEEKRNNGVFLSVLGFGMGNYKDSKMEKLADKGNGNYFYIDNFMEAEKVLGRELKGSLYTLAKDVKLQLEFNPALISEYRLIGYENRILNTRDFDDDKKDAGELGAGQEVTALYELIPAITEQAQVLNDLRYHTISKSNETRIDEIGIVKFRYKQPLDSTSKLFTHVINSNVSSFANASLDFKFAAAVTEYGMILRKSKFAGTSTIQSALEMARNNVGNDENNDRGEFVKLCREVVTISDNLSAK
jgi:Ca-activated chloride channel family protein